MRTLFRFTLVCASGCPHQDGEASPTVFTYDQFDLQRGRQEEAARQVDAKRPACGPHRVVGPHPA